MSDVVERLRAEIHLTNDASARETISEAADEIERLRAELAEIDEIMSLKHLHPTEPEKGGGE